MLNLFSIFKTNSELLRLSEERSHRAKLDHEQTLSDLKATNKLVNDLKGLLAKANHHIAELNAQINAPRVNKVLSTLPELPIHLRNDFLINIQGLPASLTTEEAEYIGGILTSYALKPQPSSISVHITDKTSSSGMMVEHIPAQQLRDEEAPRSAPKINPLPDGLVSGIRDALS